MRRPDAGAVRQLAVRFRIAGGQESPLGRACVELRRGDIDHRLAPGAGTRRAPGAARKLFLPPPAAHAAAIRFGGEPRKVRRAVERLLRGAPQPEFDQPRQQPLNHSRTRPGAGAHQPPHHLRQLPAEDDDHLSSVGEEKGEHLGGPWFVVSGRTRRALHPVEKSCATACPGTRGDRQLAARREVAAASRRRGPMRNPRSNRRDCQTPVFRLRPIFSDDRAGKFMIPRTRSRDAGSQMSLRESADRRRYDRERDWNSISSVCSSRSSFDRMRIVSRIAGIRAPGTCTRIRAIPSSVSINPRPPKIWT